MRIVKSDGSDKSALLSTLFKDQDCVRCQFVCSQLRFVQANILVAENGTAVLADFGFAKLVSRYLQTSTGYGIGTYAYM